MTGKRKAVSALLLCAVGVGIAGLQCGLTTQYYRLSTGKIPAGEGVRLVVLSDLHSGTYGKNQRQLLYHIREQLPDLLLLCGDIVDDKRSQDCAKQLLEQLADIAPCYYVSGNHEFWSDDPEAIFQMIEGHCISVLRNAYETITVNDVNLTICGVDDPAAYGSRQPRAYGDDDAYRSALEKFDMLPDDYFTVLLAHRPEYIAEYAEHPFDLTLCGHAHGGQWRIPYFMNGLIAPNQGWFPKYAGGQYVYGNMTEIVSRGLARDWKPRLFNPPELVVVDVEGTADS